jgi:hypothetical protein
MLSVLLMLPVQIILPGLLGLSGLLGMQVLIVLPGPPGVLELPALPVLHVLPLLWHDAYLAINPDQRGRISTVDLILLTSPYQLLLILKNIFFIFYKPRYLNEEANNSEPSPSVRVS